VALADRHGKDKPPKGEQRHYRDREQVRHGNQDYIYRGGRFYRPGRGGLIAVAAPVGAIVATLPFGISAVVAGGNTYFHADGSYYRQTSHGYMVCVAPVVPPAQRRHPERISRTVVVQPARLNIRSGPGPSFAVSDQVARGERLHIRANSGGWYYVETPHGTRGWVMVQFTSPYLAG
jgi:uncharacterized protein YgiM (DUF1202 family)